MSLTSNLNDNVLINSIQNYISCKTINDQDSKHVRKLEMDVVAHKSYVTSSMIFGFVAVPASLFIAPISLSIILLAGTAAFGLRHQEMVVQCEKIISGIQTKANRDLQNLISAKSIVAEAEAALDKSEPKPSKAKFYSHDLMISLEALQRNEYAFKDLYKFIYKD